MSSKGAIVFANWKIWTPGDINWKIWIVENGCNRSDCGNGHICGIVFGKVKITRF